MSSGEYPEPNVGVSSDSIKLLYNSRLVRLSNLSDVSSVSKASGVPVRISTVASASSISAIALP